MKDKSIRVLIVEDSEDDALLTIRSLEKGGYNPVYERVETATAMKQALQAKQWDIILCDYSLPKFNAPSALALLKETNIDIPIIIVSRTIGEDLAIECMRLGAQDYIMKDNPSRLCPAIARELEEADFRNKQKRAEEALQKRDSLLKSISNNIPDAMIYQVVIKGDGTRKFTYLSDSVRQLHGISPEEAIADSTLIYSKVIEDDLALLKKAEDEALKTFSTFKIDVRMKNPSGEIRWDSLRSTPKLMEDGSICWDGIEIVITKRKKAEEEISKLASIVQFSSDLVNLSTLDGKMIFLNEAGSKILGIDPDKVGDHSIMDVIPEQFLTTFRQEIIPALQNGNNWEGELQYRNIRTGVLTDVHAMTFNIKDAVTGVPLCLANVSRDITESKKAEESLLRESNFSRAALDSLTALFYMYDNQGRFIRWNKYFKTVTGYSGEELARMTPLDVVVANERAFLQRTMETVLTTKHVSAELSILCKDGNVKPHFLTGNLIEFENKQCVIGMGIDITESKRAEEKLRQSESNLKTAQAQTHIGSWEQDAFTNNISWSDEMFSIFERDSALGVIQIADLLNMIHPDDRELVKRSYEQLINKDTSFTYEHRIMHSDGRVIFIEARGNVVYDDKGNLIKYSGTAQDITERKHAEEQLHRTLDRLNKAVVTTIQVLVSAVESRDPYTAGHQLRVSNLACAIATEMGLDKERIEGIRMASSIHDIGKLSIPAEILVKPTKLTNIEFLLIKEHSQNGYEMLKCVDSPWPLAQIVYQHHERMDGSGYPRKLKGDEIILEARILAVADVVEAMASHRPYRPSLGIEVALEEIERNKGISYDNNVADICLRLFREKGFQLA